MLYAFDRLEFNGEDLWLLPLGDGKTKLARVPAGIAFNEHTDEDGAVVFQRASALDRSLAASDQECFRRLKR
jgi:hypothetical protein